MTDLAGLDPYGSLTEPATLTISRLLPGPIERVWAYLTDETLRRQWLAAGAMDLRIGAPFEFVWRNEEISDPPGERPAGFPAEHRMQSSIIALDAPRLLVIGWGVASEVTFELSPKGDQVLLTVIHRRLPDRASMLNVSAGWHAHLDALVERLAGRAPTSFWDGWVRLKQAYEARLPI